MHAELLLPVSFGPFCVSETGAVVLLFAHRYLDHVYVMAYDYYGTWSSTLGHQSPLYVRDEHRHDPSESLLSQVSV